MNPPGHSVRCVGCGAWVAAAPGPVHRYMTAAPACWAMFGELNAKLLSDPEAAGYRQLCVDAYAVQHPGKPNAQAIQSVAAHLVSLYSAVVLKAPVGRGPDLIRAVARGKGRYRWLTPPSGHSMTVGDLVGCGRGLEGRAREWAEAAWGAWRAHHDEVERWYSELVIY